MNPVLVRGLPTLPDLTVREARPWETVAGHVAAGREQWTGSPCGQAGRPLGRPDGAGPRTTERERSGHVTLARASWALAARCSGLVLELHPGPRPQGARPRKEWVCQARAPGTAGEEARCGCSSARLAVRPWVSVLSSAKRRASGCPRPLPRLPSSVPEVALKEEDFLRNALLLQSGTPPAWGLGSGATRALPSRNNGRQ